jgi:hypothetical protein
MKRDMTLIEARCDAIIGKHRGRGDPVSYQDMALELEADPRVVRQAVANLIKVFGKPICSSYASNRPGYYYPRTADEVIACHNSLVRHGVEIIQRARRISKASLEDVFGQMRTIVEEQERGV